MRAGWELHDRKFTDFHKLKGVYMRTGWELRDWKLTSFLELN